MINQFEEVDGVQKFFENFFYNININNAKSENVTKKDVYYADVMKIDIYLSTNSYFTSINNV